MTELEDFLTEVLLPLRDDEVYIAYLVTRKKYYPLLARSEENFANLILKGTSIPYLKRKLDTLWSVTYPASNPPTLAFAMYIDLNPKSSKQAFRGLINAGLEWIFSGNIQYLRKIDREWFSQLHKTKGRKEYAILDIDTKDETLLDKIASRFDKITWISETHGGYHIILPRTEFQNLYNLTKGGEIPSVEVLKEPQTPVPSYSQGGFVVRRRRKKP